MQIAESARASYPPGTLRNRPGTLRIEEAIIVLRSERLWALQMLTFTLSEVSFESAFISVHLSLSLCASVCMLACLRCCFSKNKNPSHQPEISDSVVLASASSVVVLVDSAEQTSS